MSPDGPARLLDGGTIDGEPASPEMLELLGTLRDATPPAPQLRAARRALGRRFGWLASMALLIAAGAGLVDARPPPLRPVDAGSAEQPTSAPSIDVPAPIPPAPAAPTPESPPPAALAAPARPRARRARPAVTSTAPEAEAVVALAAALPPSTAVAPEAAPPSATYAAALAEYARGCCDCAVTPLQRVVEGSTDDGEPAVQRAELLLGTCLARIGYVESARLVLDGIVARGPEHRSFSEALGELSRLAPRLPDPSVLVSTFRRDDEARIAGEADPAAASAAAYLAGRARYEDAELGAAVTLLARVAPSSPFHRPARFYEGLAEVRLHHAARAEAAFVAVIDASSGDDRFRDMATLALARLYYAAAESRHDEGDEAAARERALLDRALAAWRRVPTSSEQFLDAFFEESWALYLAGDDERALGHVFGLLSPFFEEVEHPEAFVIRGTIHYEHCLFDEAEADVREFHARYDAVLPAIARLSALDDEGVIALHESGDSALDGVTRGMVRSSIHDRDTLRRAEHARAIAAEAERLVASPFGDGPLGARLVPELSVEHGIARARLADTVRERLRAVEDALIARMNEMDTIALETTTARRDVLTGAAVLTEESRHEREVIAELGFEVWPFDGEYWADEVTSYREVVSDRCGR